MKGSNTLSINSNHSTYIRESPLKKNFPNPEESIENLSNASPSQSGGATGKIHVKVTLNILGYL